MSRAALVFPGQGAQTVGMAKGLYDGFAAARDLFAQTSEAAGVDLAALCFEGPAEKLALTEFTQPCILAASLAAFAVLATETGIKPAFAAGHSLGEYSALAAAGALSPSDAARAVRNRGKWMQEAVPPGEGAMAAVMKLTPSQIAEACRRASANGDVSPANDNAPGQVVVSGKAEAVGRVLEIIKEMGGRARMLNVSGPFHSNLMQSAAQKMDKLLSSLSFSAPAFPVVSNLEARPYPGPEAARGLLVGQITRPVRWRESVEFLAAAGVDLFIEAGPGNVLAGLIDKILPGARVLPMHEPGHLDAIKAALS